MKQRRHGKKVYNWHRPLGRSQLRRRFLRGRDTIRSVDSELAHLHDDSDSSVELDFLPYELSNYCCETCYLEAKGYGHENEVTEFSVKQLLDAVLRPSQWLQELDELADRLRTDREPLRPLSIAPSFHAIEERLFEHLQLIHGHAGQFERLQRTVLEAAGNIQRLETVRRTSEAIGTPHFGRMLLLFSPFWIRDPLQWDESAEPLDLLRFLFVKREAPGFLFPVWLRSDNLNEIHLKWILWLIIIGQGGSLKRASRHFPWAVSAKHQGYLSEVPDDFSPVEAMRLVEIKRLGGSLTTFRRLQEFQFFNFDPVEDHYEHRPFWEATVRWLSRHEAELCDEDSHDILQWAIHEYTERRARGGFSWKNRSVAGCRRNADTYFNSLNLGGQNLRWKSKGWDSEFEDEAGVRWRLTELLDGEALVKEGQYMRHCVSLYSIRCYGGDCAIFSLQREGARQITVEVDLHQRRVVQARGKFNRPADASEQAAIARWFSELELPSPS
ncbi:PcfJ domain-containing protein [Pelagicoccus sp. SDUM812005]|nr:PcfJ domain-containing protein [Pelagicoccus sp. SDUM812005]